MNGPWEKYAKPAETEAGPWARYAQPTPETTAPVAAQPAPTRSMLSELGRQTGLTARAGIQGVTAIPQMVGDAFGLRSSQAVTSVLDRVLPKPTGGVEEFVGNVASAMAGAGGLARVGQSMAQSVGPVVQRVGQVLGAGPGSQVAASASGAAASDVVRQGGGGEGAQMAAGLAGAFAPAAIQAGGSAALRGVVRGGEQGRQTMLRNMSDAQAAGIEQPTVGMVTQSRIPQGIESTAAKIPGGAGVMAKTAEKAAEDAAKRIDSIAGSLSPRATATDAGLAIEKGLKAFVQRFRGEQDFLYGKLDEFIPKTTPIDTPNTRTALASLNADIPNAPELSKWFKNAKIQGIESAYLDDLGTNATALPYEAIKKLRTLVGREIESNSLVAEVPRDKWKTLYAALSNDLEAAATKAGPEAKQAFSRANAFTSAGHKRIENILDRVSGKETAEKVFQAAINPSEIREGATTIRGVMRSLGPEERDTVKAAFLQRLGRATAGNQDAAGDVFSFNTFLTNWNKISPEAKQTLFAGGKEGRLRADMEEMARVAELVKNSGKVFANPSGTTQGMMVAGSAGAIGAAAMSGNLAPVGVAGATMVGANFLAQKAKDQEFIRWLAKSTKMNEGAIAAQVNALAQSARTAAQGSAEESAQQPQR